MNLLQKLLQSGLLLWRAAKEKEEARSGSGIGDVPVVKARLGQGMDVAGQRNARSGFKRLSYLGG